MIDAYSGPVKSTHKEIRMTILTLAQIRPSQDTLAAVLEVAGYVGLALLLALMLGLLLSGSDWTLPMEPAIAAGFTA